MFRRFCFESILFKGTLERRGFEGTDESDGDDDGDAGERERDTWGERERRRRLRLLLVAAAASALTRPWRRVEAAIGSDGSSG